MYPDIGLKVFISPISFLVEFLGSFICKIMLSAKENTLASSFPICIPFSCLVILAMTSHTILNRYGESGRPCLAPDF